MTNTLAKTAISNNKESKKAPNYNLGAFLLYVYLIIETLRVITPSPPKIRIKYSPLYKVRVSKYAIVLPWNKVVF